MNHLDSNYYVEVKGHQYGIQPTEKIIIRLRDPPKSLRTQYQVQYETQIRKNQKVMKTDKDELVVESYPKNEKLQIQQSKFNPRNCPSC